MSNPF